MCSRTTTASTSCTRFSAHSSTSTLLMSCIAISSPRMCSSTPTRTSKYATLGSRAWRRRAERTAHPSRSTRPTLQRGGTGRPRSFWRRGATPKPSMYGPWAAFSQRSSAGLRSSPVVTRSSSSPSSPTSSATLPRSRSPRQRTAARARTCARCPRSAGGGWRTCSPPPTPSRWIC
eukprot:Amastigsp_a509387_154.p2 type:complete len:175 gc:universal Amastigsp_a509387_154:969-445(-)